MGGLDSSVLERIAKIMSYMTVAGEDPCASDTVCAAGCCCYRCWSASRTQ